MVLKLNISQLGKIKLHLESCYPEEGCCILTGVIENDVKTLKEIAVVKNIATDNRKRRYLVDPAKYSEIEKWCRRNGMEIIGIAHSHPEHPSMPSEFDRQNSWPFFSYLIISVKSGKSDSVKSWVLKDDRSGFEEESIL
ncbi:MAG: M67 family metallopeptidase [Candidatus Aenigmarchaeota archaeon]|nr:M67 family metallopeptidase [Candidatus Aenigmarchaeota archaeon]